MKHLIPILALLSLLALAACGGASPDAAIATGVAATLEAQAIQTAVQATQRAQNTPTPEPQQLYADQAADYLAELAALRQRWLDALEIADSTARISLAGPVGELQAIRREIGALEGPACAQGAGAALYIHSEAVIDGFLLFMQDEPESQINAKFDEALTALELYDAALGDIRAEVAQATRTAAAATRTARATPTARATD
jgi:hypothetical protein